MKRPLTHLGRMLIFGLCLLLFNVTVLAQASALTYGSGASGSLSSTAPFAFYTFTGNADDHVDVQVIALSEGLQPAVGLNSPTQQQLAFNSGDPFTAGLARISYRLPQTGIYTLLVSSGGALGDFAIRLDGSPAPPVTELSEDTPSESSLAPDNPQLVYQIPLNPDAPLTVTISSDTVGFAFAAIVRNDSGQTVATLSGSSLQPITAILPPGDATYEIEVRAVGAVATGNIQVSVGVLGAAEPPATPDEPEIDTTEEADVPPPATTEEVDITGECRATNTSGNGVNVRSGPGTDYDAINLLQPNVEVAVLGINSPSGWYLLSLPNNTQGWVLGDLLTLTGDCSQLDEVAAPPAPDAQPTATTSQQQVQPTATTAQQGQPTATYTPSYTPTTAQQQGQATATYTPSYTPTTAQQQQATATYTPSYTPTTPPPPPTAPEDARFNSPLTIQLDSTTSVTDFVSYPNGDREDRVSYSVRGMNSSVALPGGRARLIISVSCFGTGTDQIQFFTGGNTYSCGETIVDREVTFDSNTGSVVITAVGGENTYVQWVLTGTATRNN